MERGQIANAMEVGLQGKRGTCPRHPCRVGGEVIPLTQLGSSSANQATEDVQQCSPPLTWQRTGIDTFKGFENHALLVSMAVGIVWPVCGHLVRFVLLSIVQ